MANSREDFTFPVETSQGPMFRLLGVPETDKRRLFMMAATCPFARIMKDTLDWFDHYLRLPAQ